MSRTLRIYHAERERSVLVLTIALQADGTAALTPGTEDPAAAEFIIDLVGRGFDLAVPSTTTPGGLELGHVEPKDGAPYLDAVEDMLGRSSRWVVVPE